MKKPKISKQKFTEKGKEIYYLIKPKLEKKHSPEDYVSIDIETGDYFVGKSGIEAIEKAQKKHPRKKFFLAQVGTMSGILK